MTITDTSINPRLIVPPKFQAIVDTICRHLHTRAFTKAEKNLLDFVKMAFHLQSPSKIVLEQVETTLHILYNRFNRYYIEWIEEQGKNIREEVQELSSDEHSNYLLAHCTDPTSMDDMLWELQTYVATLPTPENKEELQYNLEVYPG